MSLYLFLLKHLYICHLPILHLWSIYRSCRSRSEWVEVEVRRVEVEVDCTWYKWPDVTSASGACHWRAETFSWFAIYKSSAQSPGNCGLPPKQTPPFPFLPPSFDHLSSTQMDEIKPVRAQKLGNTAQPRTFLFGMPRLSLGPLFRWSRAHDAPQFGDASVHCSWTMGRLVWRSKRCIIDSETFSWVCKTFSLQISESLDIRFIHTMCM
jgi:hypothetical protein